jgi:hypothetical protein
VLRYWLLPSAVMGGEIASVLFDASASVCCVTVVGTSGTCMHTISGWSAR